MLSAFFSGMSIGASLIIAIGAQNAFVIRHGLKRTSPVLIALICAACDAILILFGVAGLGTLIATSSLWTELMAWCGAIFLAWYGFKSFQSLWSEHALQVDNEVKQSRRNILLATLAITLLNPHVYLDTIVLLGAVGAQFEQSMRLYFTLGAITSSFIWFFTISLGAAWASPYLSRPITWKVIDLLTGVVMWSVGLSLIIS
jgi:L-lysine exporter family protein LysE/ArgO